MLVTNTKKDVSGLDRNKWYKLQAIIITFIIYSFHATFFLTFITSELNLSYVKVFIDFNFNFNLAFDS